MPVMDTFSNQLSDENPAWKCRHKSGPDVRNLVVCVDGSARPFGEKNTNVVELYQLIRKEVGSNQLTWYNSGIGVYARPSWKSLHYYRQFIDSKIDLAIAWNFERTVLAAYRWLSDNYQEGDRIFLFGFSRGAFQVRVLAAMIDKVGLIHKGNEQQIPFAYQAYADSSEFISKAQRFKAAFSHHNANVHYVGAWDTVSSIGLLRTKQCIFPGTVDGMKHVCYFRHALALDERRVKLAPEYAYGGAVGPIQTQKNSKPGTPPQTLEVWFAGTHSDIGGANVPNTNRDLSVPPLRWMVFESAAAGLRTKRFDRVVSSNEQIKVKESLTGIWWPLECLPLERWTYTRRAEGKPRTLNPHMGKGRKIHDGQKIHSSVMVTNQGRDSYIPKARPFAGNPNFWREYLTTAGLGDWKVVDLFEETQNLVIKFLDRQDGPISHLLRRTATTVYGRQAVYEATLAVLRIPHTPQTRVKFITNITDVLDQSERKDTPLMKSDLKDVRMLFIDITPTNNNNLNDHDVAVCGTFLRRFTKFQPRVEVLGHDWGIRTVAIVPIDNNTRVISGLEDCTIRSWDAVTGDPIGEHFRGHTSVIDVVVVSSDGRVLISGSNDGTIYHWDVERGTSAELLGHIESVRCLAISPDGKWVASGSEDDTVRIWDVENRTQVGEPLVGHGSTVYAVGFSRGGRQVVSCSIDRTARIWDVETHQPVVEPLILGHDEDWLLSAAISSDGSRLAAGFSDESVRIWDLNERKMVGNPCRLHKAMVHSVAFSPDGRRVVSASSDGAVLVWDAETQQSENHFQHEDWVKAVTFFPDGKSVATGCDDGMIRIWSTDPWY